MEQALVVLVTGLVVVFSMLIILIAIIKLYSKLIVYFENIFSEKKQSKEPAPGLKEEEPESEPEVVPIDEAYDLEPDSDDIPAEIVAAISAAVVYLEGENTKIRKIQKVNKRTSVNGSLWGYTGRVELTNPF